MSSISEFVHAGIKLSNELNNMLSNLPDNLMFPKPEPLRDYSQIARRSNNYDVNISEDFFVPISHVNPNERFENNIIVLQTEKPTDIDDYNAIGYGSDDDPDDKKPEPPKFTPNKDFMKFSTKFDKELWEYYKQDYLRSTKTEQTKRPVRNLTVATDQDKQRDEEILAKIEESASNDIYSNPLYPIIEEAFFRKKEVAQN